VCLCVYLCVCVGCVCVCVCVYHYSRETTVHEPLSLSLSPILALLSLSRPPSPILALLSLSLPPSFQSLTYAHTPSTSISRFPPTIPLWSSPLKKRKKYSGNNYSQYLPISPLPQVPHVGWPGIGALEAAQTFLSQIK